MAAMSLRFEMLTYDGTLRVQAQRRLALGPDPGLCRVFSTDMKENLK
jgi:hypothetical protein